MNQSVLRKSQKQLYPTANRVFLNLINIEHSLLVIDVYRYEAVVILSKLNLHKQ